MIADRGWRVTAELRLETEVGIVNESGSFVFQSVNITERF